MGCHAKATSPWYRRVSKITKRRNSSKIVICRTANAVGCAKLSRRDAVRVGWSPISADRRGAAERQSRRPLLTCPEFRKASTNSDCRHAEPRAFKLIQFFCVGVTQSLNDVRIVVSVVARIVIRWCSGLLGYWFGREGISGSCTYGRYG